MLVAAQQAACDLIDARAHGIDRDLVERLDDQVALAPMVGVVQDERPNASSTVSRTRQDEPGRDFRGSEAGLRLFITASTSAARVSISRSNTPILMHRMP